MKIISTRYKCLVRNSSEPFKITGGGRYISSLKIIRSNLCPSSNLRLSRFFLEHGSSQVDCGIFPSSQSISARYIQYQNQKTVLPFDLYSLPKAGFGICYCQSLLLIKNPSLFQASTSLFSPDVLPASLIIAFTISVGSSLSVCHLNVSGPFLFSLSQFSAWIISPAPKSINLTLTALLNSGSIF